MSYNLEQVKAIGKKRKKKLIKKPNKKTSSNVI